MMERQARVLLSGVRFLGRIRMYQASCLLLFITPPQLPLYAYPRDLLEEAKEYFEKELSNATVRSVGGIKSNGSLNCESWSDHIHMRTRSDDQGVRPPKVGFKPTLNCHTPKPPEHVKAHGWIYYDYWGRWDQATYKVKEFENKGSLQQTNLEVGCAGEKNTLFWGTSYIEITYNGQPYFGQSAPNAVFLKCTIDRG